MDRIVKELFSDVEFVVGLPGKLGSFLGFGACDVHDVRGDGCYAGDGLCGGQNRSRWRSSLMTISMEGRLEWGSEKIPLITMLMRFKEWRKLLGKKPGDHCLKSK